MKGAALSEPRSCCRWGRTGRLLPRGGRAPGRAVGHRARRVLAAREAGLLPDRRVEEGGKEGAARFPPPARPLLLPPRLLASLPAAPARLPERRPPSARGCRPAGRREGGAACGGGSWMKTCASGRVGHEGDRGDSALPCPAQRGHQVTAPHAFPPPSPALRASPRPGPGEGKRHRKSCPPAACRGAEEGGEEASPGCRGCTSVSARPTSRSGNSAGSLRRCSSRRGGGGGGAEQRGLGVPLPGRPRLGAGAAAGRKFAAGGRGAGRSVGRGRSPCRGGTSGHGRRGGSPHPTRGGSGVGSASPDLFHSCHLGCRLPRGGRVKHP